MAHGFTGYGFRLWRLNCIGHPRQLSCLKGSIHAAPRPEPKPDGNNRIETLSNCVTPREGKDFIFRSVTCIRWTTKAQPTAACARRCLRFHCAHAAPKLLLINSHIMVVVPGLLDRVYAIIGGSMRECYQVRTQVTQPSFLDGHPPFPLRDCGV